MYRSHLIYLAYLNVESHRAPAHQASFGPCLHQSRASRAGTTRGSWLLCLLCLWVRERVIKRIHMWWVCDMTHQCVCYETFTCGPWLVCVTQHMHVCAMNHSHVCHDSCVWYNAFICVLWIIHMCAMNRVCGTAYSWVTTLIHRS